MSWKEVKIGEVCKVGRGSSPRPIDNKAYFEGGQIPWIKIADATNSGKVIYETKEHVNSFGASFSRLLKEGSLILATSGVSLGQVKFLGMEGCIHDGWLYLDDFKGCDKNYMYYILINLTSYFHSQSYGAAIQNINTDILRETKIQLPPLPTQQKIASILSAYDDLIENNLKRIKLLEEAAQHLYWEWFVKFRFPGWEAVRVVDGLPEGWERKKLNEVLELYYGKALKAEDRKEGIVPVFGSSGIVGFHNLTLAKGPGIIVGRKGNVGSVFWSFDDFYPIDTVYFVSSKISFYFLFFNLKTQNFVNSDSAVPGLNRNSAYQLEAIVPESEILEEFERIVQPFFRQKNILEKQNQRLKEARDLLLPRLMNQMIEV